MSEFIQGFASWLLISKSEWEPSLSFSKHLDSVQERDEGIVDPYQFRLRVSKFTGEPVFCYCCKPFPSIQHDTNFLPPKVFWQMIMFAGVVVSFLLEAKSNHKTSLKLRKILFHTGITSHVCRAVPKPCPTKHRLPWDRLFSTSSLGSVTSDRLQKLVLSWLPPPRSLHHWKIFLNAFFENPNKKISRALSQSFLLLIALKYLSSLF